MKRINKKINEVYVSKKITLLVPYRGKTREIVYYTTAVYGTAMQITANLRSIRLPCPIPKMENISIKLNNEYPTKRLINAINKKIK